MSERNVALVTGGTRGIGRGISLALAECGYDVAVSHTGSNEAAAAEIVSELENRGAAAIEVRSDIGSAPDRARLLDAVRGEFGRLNLLVNNAGVAPLERKDILEAGEESFDRILTTNLKGPYFLTQLAAQWMIDQRREYTEAFLAVVNISSVSSYTSSTNRGDYCLSKAAVSMSTMLWADRLAEFGIMVYEVRPGIIATDMTSRVKEKYDRLIFEENITPQKRWGTPEDAGKAVAAIAGGSFPFSTGQIFEVDGGFHLRRL